MLNKVEIRGIVGSVNVTEVGGETAVRFSVATDYIYKSRGRETIVETIWHNCTAWSSTAPDAKKLERGKGVHLTGRLRNARYASADCERIVTEIFVNTLKIISL